MTAAGEMGAEGAELGLGGGLPPDGTALAAVGLRSRGTVTEGRMSSPPVDLGAETSPFTTGMMCRSEGLGCRAGASARWILGRPRAGSVSSASPGIGRPRGESGLRAGAERMGPGACGGEPIGLETNVDGRLDSSAGPVAGGSSGTGLTCAPCGWGPAGGFSARATGGRTGPSRPGGTPTSTREAPLSGCRGSVPPRCSLGAIRDGNIGKMFPLGFKALRANRWR